MIHQLFSVLQSITYMFVFQSSNYNYCYSLSMFQRWPKYWTSEWSPYSSYCRLFALYLIHLNVLLLKIHFLREYIRIYLFATYLHQKKNFVSLQSRFILTSDVDFTQFFECFFCSVLWWWTLLKVCRICVK